MWDVILPIDFHMFQHGEIEPPTRYYQFYMLFNLLKHGTSAHVACAPLLSLRCANAVQRGPGLRMPSAATSTSLPSERALLGDGKTHGDP